MTFNIGHTLKCGKLYIYRLCLYLLLEISVSRQSLCSDLALQIINMSLCFSADAKPNHAFVYSKSGLVNKIYVKMSYRALNSCSQGHQMEGVHLRRHVRYLGGIW